MRKWRSAAATAAWVAVGTAAGALGAWQLAGADSGGGAAHSRPLDEAAVREALARASDAATPPGAGAADGTGTPPSRQPSGTGPQPPGRASQPPGTGPQPPGKTSHPSGTASREPARKPPEPTRTPVPERSTVRFTGGSATVECRTDGTVFLVSWSPADGFHIDDDVTRGPAAVARLEAEPGDDDERDDLPYEIRCTADGPRARPAADGGDGADAADTDDD
ncbi:hypothetical protein AB0I16_06350 [Streptomyces sp. NPDC050703]|uniref:hypothetical protein n=1 Tax=Streptomyces sp. NPDC050703 TaxID=3157218 RepID=UPI00341DEA35